MTRPSRFVLLAFSLLLAGLAVTPAGVLAAAAPAAVDRAQSESQKLHTIFDEYFEEYLQQNPILATSIGDPRYNDRFVVGISPAAIAAEEKLHREYLARLQTVDRAALPVADQLSFDIFKTGREREIEGFKFPDELIPLNQFYSTPNSFAQLGSGNGMQPFKTVQDYDNFLKRLDGFVAWTDQAIVNMKQGVQRGYTLPKVLAERTVPQLEAHIVAKPEESLYWGPITKMPADFSAADRERLTGAYRAAIETRVVPTYRKLRDYMRDEYLPKTRLSDGMEGLPNGKAWYAYNVKRVTTTDYTPEQIHQIGLDEVKRIHGEMEAVMKQVGFKGTRNEFFKHLNTDPQFFFDHREDLIAGYDAIRKRVNPRLPQLFETLPRADYEVRAVEPFREKSAAGGQYQAANEDGTRPGIFYANAYDLRARPKWAMEALSLHEANPGHHFQISIQREQQGLPKFRRFGGYTAFSEGWALYAESLGQALGMYTDPYQYFGALEAELWRAIRLVVDTGLHSKGWTREQVLEYMDANSSAAEARRVSETERYMAIPGQALAYKIGQLKLSELRARAEQELGPKFDVRKFHTAVLMDGALPLDVLEAKVDRWIASQR
ncbi:MAG: DUF885 domain-containing protein [Steroidobacteraceae bacterium]|nr:DUF885 domain-containing protein [Steroidobacteraceae bacterium]MBP9130767.1 DUF885 domain-containing protein [Steroidobacteraceae bacterium]